MPVNWNIVKHMYWNVNIDAACIHAAKRIKTILVAVANTMSTFSQL